MKKMSAEDQETSGGIKKEVGEVKNENERGGGGKEKEEERKEEEKEIREFGEEEGLVEARKGVDKELDVRRERRRRGREGSGRSKMRED